MKRITLFKQILRQIQIQFSLGIIFTIIAQIFMLFTPKLISSSFKVIEAFSKDKTSRQLLFGKS
jgi:ATP-binding cassette subfamily B protein